MWERVRSGLASASPKRPIVRPGLWTRARDWVEAYRGHFVTGVVAAAAGAVVATFVTSRLAATLPLANAAAAQSAEVESLEVLGGSGMVFQEPAADKNDTGTTVIWVTSNEPSDDDDGDPTTLPPPPGAEPPKEGGAL
jgi:hypothetical protein